MKKSEMHQHILSNYSNMLKLILLAKLDVLKNGQFYGWNVNSISYRLARKENNYFIEEVK